MRLAVTGGIAEGKSTVVRYLAEAGYATASADAIAKDVFQTNEVQSFLRERLGSADPGEVRQAVARDQDFRRDFNGLTHPRILDGLKASTANVFEVPLLVEAVLHPLFDRVWVVTCGSEEQFRRLESRLGSQDAARELLHTQLRTEVKIHFADRIVRTNLPEESVRRYVIEAVKIDLG